jgi:chemotaxis methyl-accepting protein methylase/transcriptional regulator with PAS, ATPase and Fis domain
MKKRAAPVDRNHAVTRTSAAMAEDMPVTDDFPVVGIGCSAGGLDALEKFFSLLAPASGMAFVVVQHLDPDRESALPALLARYTTLPVVEVKDRMPLEPDHVYVIPPGKDLSLLDGRLELLDLAKPHGQNLPIDFFLRSLAHDRQNKAVGVILSGMGSDGLMGLRAIKDMAGLTLAQDPSTAIADSMPRSAIASGAVDITAPPAELPGHILEYFRHPRQSAAHAHSEDESSLNDLEKIILLLRDHTGNDFSLYKSNTLLRRVERRIALHQRSDIRDYLKFLRQNPQELGLLFRELLIGVTSFFRDPDIWTLLRTETIPELLAQHPPGRPIRAWVPACSSGEEAYSLAIAFKDAWARTQPNRRFEFQIFATDLDPDAIEKARRGVFPANIAADVPLDLLTRYFVEEDGGYKICREIREMLIFAPQNIISDPPFTKLDFLSCRNLLIYFRHRLQKTLLPLFHYALNPNGFLLLGNAETIGSFTQLFAPINSKARLYCRINQPLPLMSELSFPKSRTAGDAIMDSPTQRTERTENIGQLTDQLIQQNYAPAAVLVNGEGDILYISGRTGKYLEPAAGKVNMNIHAMARDGLREALMGVIHKVLRERQPICLNNLQVGSNGGTQIVNVTVQAIDKPEPLKDRVIIVFRDVSAAPKSKRGRKTAANPAQDELRQELQQTREALQTSREEMHNSLEELKSSNEELQSSNEELQSTNEELTTSKEEMQSLNEELQTVNAELQSKVDDLTSVKNDMTNLLNSTEVATLFLDSEMKLRRFTPHATSVFKLMPSDIGRPFSHIVSDLDYPNLLQDALDVLNTLMFKEVQAGARDGRWFRVRVMPYRTLDNVIDGVVITFIDISDIRSLKTELNKLRG